MTKPPIGGNRTGRKLGQKVKKGKLKASSRRWLERHINDPYVQRAQLDPTAFEQEGHDFVELDRFIVGQARRDT